MRYGAICEGRNSRFTVYDQETETETVTPNNRIEINPDIMLGKPVIKGTRIPIELIVRKLGEGASVEDLLDAYPNLKKEDIQAALIYAADTLANEMTIYLDTGT